MENLKQRIGASGLKKKFIAKQVGIKSASHLTMMLNGNAKMSKEVEKSILKLLKK